MNEVLREFFKDDLEKAAKQGLEQGREDLIAQMLDNGKSPEAIADFTSIPISYVQNVQRNIAVVRERSGYSAD